MIIFKRPVPPDDHLQEAGSSGWSVARGRSLLMIIEERTVPTDDLLQVAGSSGWSFARGGILRMISCKRPYLLDDHLQEAGSSGWSVARGRILRMIICNNNNKSLKEENCIKFKTSAYFPLSTKDPCYVYTVRFVKGSCSWISVKRICRMILSLQMETVSSSFLF